MLTNNQHHPSSLINHDQRKTKKSSTKRMQRWRAANKDKNKMNDLRCRVYKLARKKFKHDCIEKENFIKEQITIRLEKQKSIDQQNDLLLLPFYNQPRHQFELPFIHQTNINHYHSSIVHLPPLTYPSSSKSLDSSESSIYYYSINLPLLSLPKHI
ncbi:unnamed protein product [Cunninghamella blakesleeana]